MLDSHGRIVQRHVVKHGAYVVFLESGNEFGAASEIRQQDVVHVGVVPAFGWHNRATYLARLFQGGQRLMISLPHLETALSDGFGFLHLRPEEGRNDLAWQI